MCQLVRSERLALRLELRLRTLGQTVATITTQTTVSGCSRTPSTMLEGAAVVRRYCCAGNIQFISKFLPKNRFFPWLQLLASTLVGAEVVSYGTAIVFSRNPWLKSQPICSIFFVLVLAGACGAGACGAGGKNCSFLLFAMMVLFRTLLTLNCLPLYSVF